MKNKNMPFIITLTVAFLLLVGSNIYFTSKNSSSKNESANTDIAESETKADNDNVVKFRCWRCLGR